MCCHHWILESANGPVSLGECKLCHETREFQNTVPTAYNKTGDEKKIKETTEVIAGRKRDKLATMGMPYPVEA